MESKLSKRGFTLIEILVVVAIMGILMAGAIPSFNSYNRGQVLAQAAKGVRSDLRMAQNFSISGAEGKVWGLHLSNGTAAYYLFKCTPGTPNGASQTEYRYDPANPLAYPDCTLHKTQQMNSTTRVTSSNIDIAFEAVNAAVYINGTAAASTTDVVVDFITGIPTTPKHVCVSQSGGIREEGVGC